MCLGLLFWPFFENLPIYKQGERSAASYQTCPSIERAGIATLLKKVESYINIEVLLKDSTVEQVRGRILEPDCLDLTTAPPCTT